MRRDTDREIREYSVKQRFLDVNSFLNIVIDVLEGVFNCVIENALAGIFPSERFFHPYVWLLPVIVIAVQQLVFHVPEFIGQIHMNLMGVDETS